MDIKIFTVGVLSSATGTIIAPYLEQALSFLKAKILEWLDPPRRKPE